MYEHSLNKKKKEQEKTRKSVESKVFFLKGYNSFVISFVTAFRGVAACTIPCMAKVSRIEFNGIYSYKDCYAHLRTSITFELTCDSVVILYRKKQRLGAPNKTHSSCRRTVFRRSSTSVSRFQVVQSLYAGKKYIDVKRDVKVHIDVTIKAPNALKEPRPVAKKNMDNKLEEDLFFWHHLNKQKNFFGAWGDYCYKTWQGSGASSSALLLKGRPWKAAAEAAFPSTRTHFQSNPMQINAWEQNPTCSIGFTPK